MGPLRTAVVVGLVLLDGVAAVAIARLAAGPPWRAAPLDGIDRAAFAAGALGAPFLLFALLRSVGALRTILLGSLYGVLTAVMTAVLVVPLAFRYEWRNPVDVLIAVVYGSVVGLPAGVGVALLLAPTIVPAGSLLALVNGWLVRRAWAR